MNELTAAVAGAQLKKIGFIRETLQKNKMYLKSILSHVKELKFRKILDVEGDIGTLLTIFMPSLEIAERLARKLNCTAIAKSGWHVYNNMEHFLNQNTVTEEGCPFKSPYYEKNSIKYDKGMLPKTDRLLERAINISIEVSDAGLGSNFGININSSEEEIRNKVLEIVDLIRESL